MYQAGELVVYGSTGVCRVEGIAKPNLTGADRNKEYYQLKPLLQDGVIYAPIESAKVPIRPVISAGEVDSIIDRIPDLKPTACRAATLQALAQQYQNTIRTNNCGSLLEMMMSIYTKRRQAEAQNRRLGMVDERYMKQAERLVYGEFSVALGIPYEDVPAYISRRVSGFAPGTGN